MDNTMEKWLKDMEELAHKREGIEKKDRLDDEIFNKLKSIESAEDSYEIDYALAERKGEQEQLKISIRFTRFLTEVYYEIMVLEDQQRKIMKEHNVGFSNGIHYFTSAPTKYEKAVKELAELEAQMK